MTHDPSKSTPSIDLDQLQASEFQPPEMGDSTRADVRSYLSFIEQHQDAINEPLVEELRDHAVFGPVIDAMTDEQRKQQNDKSQRLQRSAFEDGAWQPWVDDLRTQGVGYAMMGVPYYAWAEVLVLLRPHVRRVLREQRVDGDQSASIINGMGVVLDIAMGEIATSYINELITEARKVAAAEMKVSALTELNRELQEFAYAASHDMRTPLRGVRNLAGWIAEDWGEAMPAPIAEQFELLVAQISRMEGLLEALLAYAKIGRDKIALETVSVGQVVESVRALLQAEDRLSLTAVDELPPIETGVAPLTQLILNLVGNAVQHRTGPTVNVTVSTADRGDYIEVSVADDGPGIPKEMRERAFQLFQALKTESDGGGVGMGLAIVKRHVAGVTGQTWIADSDGGLDVRFTWPKQWPYAD